MGRDIVSMCVCASVCLPLSLAHSLSHPHLCLCQSLPLQCRWNILSLFTAAASEFACFCRSTNTIVPACVWGLSGATAAATIALFWKFGRCLPAWEDFLFIFICQCSLFCICHLCFHAQRTKKKTKNKTNSPPLHGFIFLFYVSQGGKWHKRDSLSTKLKDQAAPFFHRSSSGAPHCMRVGQQGSHWWLYLLKAIWVHSRLQTVEKSSRKCRCVET